MNPTYNFGSRVGLQWLMRKVRYGSLNNGAVLCVGSEAVKDEIKPKDKV